MANRRRRVVLVGLMGCSLAACKETPPAGPTGGDPTPNDTLAGPSAAAPPSGATSKSVREDAESAKAVADPAGSLAATVKVVSAPPPVKRYDAPVERRLYADHIEASSFLWTNWNKFQENYHPNYLLDGDPKTAWVEGADGSGQGEWVRVPLSPITDATSVRLRLRNGYQKSASLFEKNARPTRLDIVTLPGNHRHPVEIQDTMGWQEISFAQPQGPLDAIELHVTAVKEGSRYTDLCLSDLEIYVTGTNVENPAYEKAKLGALLSWKASRIATAKLMGSAKAKTLPVLASYRVRHGDELPKTPVPDGPAGYLLRSFDDLASGAAFGQKPTIARARAAVASDFDGWVPMEAQVRDRLEIPAIDGLRAASDEEFAYGSGDNEFLLPSIAGRVLLSSEQLVTFDTKDKTPWDQYECKRNKSAKARAFRPPGKDASEGPLVKELLLIRCVTAETREGMATYSVWQLLEFDDQGRLALVSGPYNEVTAFRWDTVGDRNVLAGGVRAGRGRTLEYLEDASAQVVRND